MNPEQKPIEFTQGYDAHDSALPITRNPYPADSEQSTTWVEGWKAAKLEAGPGPKGMTPIRAI